MRGGTRYPVEAVGANRLRNYRYRPQPVQLPQRKWLIAQLVTCGLSDKEIANLIGIATSTVKVHVSSILHGVGLCRRSQLVRYFIEEGYFCPEAAEALLNVNFGQRERAVAAKEMCVRLDSQVR